MRIILISLFILKMLQAQSIDQLIRAALQKHPSLQTIKHRLSALDEEISLSQKFSNPDISLTLNDIQFADPLNRRREPMQYQAINIKQTLPWFGKRDAKKSYTQAQKKIVLDSLKAAKVALALQIRITAYTIKEFEARINIIRKYIDVSEQNIRLYTSYAATNSQNHTNSMNASLLLTKVKIKAANYKAILKSQKAKLAYLLQKKAAYISDTLQIKKPKRLRYYLSKMKHNPNYHKYRDQKDAASHYQKIQSLNTMPDPYIKVGYFQRQRFSDYTSITIGASLPIYGSEQHKTEEARKNLLAAASASIDYQSSLKSTIRSMYAKLTETYNIYTILHTETLPQLEHMFELTQSSIQEGGDLFAYTNLLEQKLDLEEESISVKAEYLRIQAKLNSLIGEL